MQVTNIDNGQIEVRYGEFRDELLTFAGADTFVKGTILARRAVAIAVAASAVTGTGNGTVTAATVIEGPTVPLVGVYTLTVQTAVADGGVWRLTDPNGAIIGILTMTVGAGAATIFEVGGLRFTITDGSTNFAAGDSATLTVAADGKVVPFNPAGAAGEQLPVGVLTYEVTKSGAGDLAIRMLTSGVVAKDRLVIDAGGNVTAAIVDQLRSTGIIPIDSKQLSVLDNQ